MNRRQEIAAWVFGVLVALWLLLTDHALWAIVVLAALTILSLRDRQKKKARGVVSDSPVTQEPTTPLPEQPLRSLTPHLLATALLELRAKGDAPFQMWRSPDAPIPPDADALVELACHFYQVGIFLDSLERRFGTPLAKLVAASLESVLANAPSGPDFFSQVSTAVDRARGLGPAQDGPDDVKLRLDLQVADQVLSFIQAPEEEKKAVRFPLAHCLSLARASAETVFPPLVAKIKFDPLSIADVPLETAHKGVTNRWRGVPGCFERHLQRKEGNPLFPASERRPSDEAIERARAKDDADLEKLKADVIGLGQSAQKLPGQMTVQSVADFQKTQVEPLLFKAAGLGHLGQGLLKTLEQIQVNLTKTIADSIGGQDGQGLLHSFEEIRKVYRFRNNLFFAQASREDTPITEAEAVPAFLSESIETIKEYMEGAYSFDPKHANTLANDALLRLTEAAQRGFELSGAEEKLGLLEEYARKSAPS